MNRVDLVAQHMLGDRQRPLIGIPPALTICGCKPAVSIALIDRLPAAMHQDRLHADVIHEDDVVEQIGEGLLIIHDRPADFDDDDFVVKSLNVPERFHQCGGLVDREFIYPIFHIAKPKVRSLEVARAGVKKRDEGLTRRFTFELVHSILSQRREHSSAVRAGVS